MVKGNVKALEVMIKNSNFHRSALSPEVFEESWALLVAIEKRDVRMLEFLWDLEIWHSKHLYEVIAKLKQKKQSKRPYFIEGIQLILKSNVTKKIFSLMETAQKVDFVY